MTEVITITVERGDNSMATSFLVWAQFRRPPAMDGDGVFVGDIPISAADSEVSYDWTAPNNNADWRFIAAPKFMEQVGFFATLEA